MVALKLWTVTPRQCVGGTEMYCLGFRFREVCEKLCTVLKESTAYLRSAFYSEEVVSVF